MKLTFLYTIFNRTELFEETLYTFLEQEGATSLEYEILVVDDGGTEPLLSMLKDFHAEGLPIKYVNLGPKPPDVFTLSDGASNPARALNVGFRLIRSDRLMLSNPEVMHARPTNLKTLVEYKLPPKSIVFFDVWDSSVQFYISGGDRRRPLCFLSMHNLSDVVEIGGVDERFMKGWAFEDNDFSARSKLFGVQWLFDRSVLGVHQWHDRPQDTLGLAKEFTEAWNHNKAMYMEQLKNVVLEANQGHNWGDTSVICERWPEE